MQETKSLLWFGVMVQLTLFMGYVNYKIKGRISDFIPHLPT